MNANWLVVRLEVTGPEGQPRYVCDYALRRTGGVTYREVLDKIDAKLQTLSNERLDDVWQWAGREP